MDPSIKEQIAAFRYGLIAPIVSRQTPMLPGELKTYLEQTKPTSFLEVTEPILVCVHWNDGYHCTGKKAGKD